MIWGWKPFWSTCTWLQSRFCSLTKACHKIKVFSILSGKMLLALDKTFEVSEKVWWSRAMLNSSEKSVIHPLGPQGNPLGGHTKPSPGNLCWVYNSCSSILTLHGWEAHSSDGENVTLVLLFLSNIILQIVTVQHKCPSCHYLYDFNQEIGSGHQFWLLFSPRGISQSPPQNDYLKGFKKKTTFFLKSRFRFTAKRRRRYRYSLCTPDSPRPVHSPPTINIPHQSGMFVTTDKPTSTHHHHPRKLSQGLSAVEW